jgi:DNA replication protein DnaC
MAEERPRLRRLKVAPDELALRFPVVVGPTGYVVHDARSYSMAPESIGMAGTLFLYRGIVRIVAGRYEAEHLRIFEPHGKSTLDEHRVSQVTAVSGKRAKRYLKRQQLIELGPAAHDVLTEIVHRRPKRWVAEVNQLHELLCAHGADALTEAFECALRARTFGAEYVALHLRAQHPAGRQQTKGGPSPAPLQSPPRRRASGSQGGASGAERSELALDGRGDGATAPRISRTSLRPTGALLMNVNPSEIPIGTLLKGLHLANARRVWRDLVERAEREQWSCRDFFAVLLAEEVAHRQQARLTRLNSRAKFPFLKTIEEFDFTYQSNLRLALMSSFLSPDFVTEGRGLILSGKTGRGKTHLAIAIAYRAIQNGFDALFTTAAELIEDLSVAGANGLLREGLPTYTHPHVLVVDEVGYLAYGTDAANVLFHVVNERHLKKRPIIFTTQRAGAMSSMTPILPRPSSTGLSSADGISSSRVLPSGPATSNRRCLTIDLQTRQ